VLNARLNAAKRNAKWCILQLKKKFFDLINAEIILVFLLKNYSKRYFLSSKSCFWGGEKW